MPAFLFGKKVTMSITQRIEEIIAPTVESMGFEVVRIRMTGGDHAPIVQIMLDRQQGGGISIDECAKVSRQISVVLDVEEVLSGRYNLEVSSPGIDRPLVRLGDYVRYVGHEAKLEMAMPLNDRKRFRGIIEAVEGELVRMKCDGELFDLPFTDISTAKLMLTDELIAAHKKTQKQVAAEQAPSEE